MVSRQFWPPGAFGAIQTMGGRTRRTSLTNHGAHRKVGSTYRGAPMGGPERGGAPGCGGEARGQRGGSGVGGIGLRLRRPALWALLGGIAVPGVVVLTAAFGAPGKDAAKTAVERSTPVGPSFVAERPSTVVRHTAGPVVEGRTVVRTATVARGDTLMALLISAGSDRRTAQRAITAVGKHFNPRRLQVGQEVVVVLDRADAARPRLAAVSLRVRKDSYAVAGRDADGGFTAKIAREPIDDRTIAAAAIEVAFAPEPDHAVRNSLRLRNGDTLMKALLRAGCKRSDANAAIAAFSQLYDPRKLRAGQMLTVVLVPDEADRPPILHGITFASAPGRNLEVGRAEGGGFAAREIEVALTRGLAHANGRIATSLYQAATDAKMPQAIMMEMILAFSFDVDFQREIQRGDSFEVVFERFHDKAGAVVREGALLYAALTLSGQPLKIYRYAEPGGGEGYFDEDGNSVRKALLRTPINGARLSSRYGKRKHPILGYTKMHRGVDFAAPRGTPVAAAGSGVIESIGWNGAYGRYIRVRHKGSYKTAYAHLSRFAKGLRKGQRVKQGQTIGRVGSTGRSTGPHLHYEVIQSGRQINPLNVKLPAGPRLTGAQLAAFDAARGDIERQRAALLLVRHVADGTAAPGTCGAPAKPAGIIALLDEDNPAQC